MKHVGRLDGVVEERVYRGERVAVTGSDIVEFAALIGLVSALV